MTGAAVEQLIDELHSRAWALTVCGLRFTDPTVPAHHNQITQLAHQLVAQLTQDTNDRLAAQTCIDIMCLLWPAGSPEDIGHPDWWRTPIGRLCARSLGRDDTEALSYSTAAAMLGVKKGTVSVWVQRGTLDRHPDGGVLRSSVITRLSTH